jgi:Pyruvate/2-oxoacid:ferredoxin oxidoreductase gamma subunit
MDQLRRRGVRTPPISYRELPPTPSGETPVLAPGEAARPSILVRRIVHLLHAVRPSLSVAARLVGADPQLEAIRLPERTGELGLDAAIEEARRIVVEVDQEIRARPDPEDGAPRPRTLSIDILPERGALDSCTVVEFYPRERFLLEGMGAVRQTARDACRRLLVVVDVSRASGGGSAGPTSGGLDLARLADASIPSDAAARVRVMRTDLNDRAVVRARVLEALEALDGSSGSGGSDARLVVLVLTDGPPPRLDPEAIDRTFVERDRLGYQSQQRLVWKADHACELRPPPLAGLLDEAEEEGATPIEGRFVHEELSMRVEGIEFRATALSEQVEVVRTKPPITAYSRGAVGLAPPRPIHADLPMHRTHVAGFRGGAPGLVARILADAGRAMGYRVEILSSDEPCGRGRRAWAQVLWMRAREGETRAPRTAMIPYGEANLLLGVDPLEALRALGPDPSLRVASPQKTSIIANDGPLEDQFDDARVSACGLLEGAVERCAMASHSSVDDYASLCRTNLLSERLLDVAMLGLAFQRGLLPVSLEAIEAAVRRAEPAGFGRSFEAFTFGRRLEAGAVVRRSVEEREPLDRLVRRLSLELVRERFGGRRRAQRYALSASGMLAAFGRLGDDEDVDRATRAVVTALHRTIVWGGTRMMRRYESLVAALLRADPTGDLALVSAEPIADAILVRDILYVLAMSTSLEQRRRIRERLGVRASHGDTLERRYLSRFELLAGARRFRLDFRTSDWPAELVRLAKPLVPWGLRGDARAQEVREYAISLAERAAEGFERDPAHWAMCMRRFAMLSTDGGLRSLSAAELRAAVEGL